MSSTLSRIFLSLDHACSGTECVTDFALEIHELGTLHGHSRQTYGPNVSLTGLLCRLCSTSMDSGK